MMPTDERDLVINKGLLVYFKKKIQFYPILGKKQQGYVPSFNFQITSFSGLWYIIFFSFAVT